MHTLLISIMMEILKYFTTCVRQAIAYSPSCKKGAELIFAALGVIAIVGGIIAFVSMQAGMISFTTANIWMGVILLVGGIGLTGTAGALKLCGHRALEESRRKMNA